MDTLKITSNTTMNILEKKSSIIFGIHEKYYKYCILNTTQILIKCRSLKFLSLKVKMMLKSLFYYTFST